MQFAAAKNLRIPDLAGVGDRPVLVDSTGKLKV
jgi:hypothetical protein